MTQRAVIYTRVSTVDQVENQSLEGQERACRDWCQRRGIEVDSVFTERGQSAKTRDRTELIRMLEHCRKNRGRIDCLVIFAVSRLSRDEYDYKSLKVALLKLGITVCSVTETFDDTPHGRVLETMLAAFAQFDNDVKSQLTTERMREAAQRGRWVFQAPLGYRVTGKKAPEPSLEPDPGTAELVRRAFEEIASGRSTRAALPSRLAVLGLRSRNGKALSAQAVHRLLGNKVYAGWVEIPKWGILCRGDFPAIVDQNTFDRSQQPGRGRPRTRRRRDHPDFPLRRFVRCAKCATPLTAGMVQGRAKKYPYYWCRRVGQCGLNIRADALEELFAQELEAMQPRPDMMRAFKEAVLEVWSARHREVRELRVRLGGQVKRIQEQQQKLMHAYVYQNAIDQTLYEVESGRLAQDLALTRMELHEAELEELDVEGILNYAESLLLNAAATWKKSEADAKRRLQSFLLPDGVSFDGERFRTAETCLSYGHLGQNSGPDSHLVSPGGFEPPSQD